MNRRISLPIISALAGLAGAIGIETAAPAGNATLNIVMVLDGLRPDSITADDTPNLWRLRQEGVNFTNGHSVFPTVTRTNATAIGTGTYPDRNGMFGNQLYVREVDPNHAFGNDDHKNLLRLDAATGGGMVLVPSLAEILAQRGKTLAVVSSGTTGAALLANPRAPKGVGVLVNAFWEPGRRVAFPDAAN
jgi:predicted AlkP superfamily pyrophosphatase or phosphodiesterase